MVVIFFLFCILLLSNIFCNVALSTDLSSFSNSGNRKKSYRLKVTSDMFFLPFRCITQETEDQTTSSLPVVIRRMYIFVFLLDNNTSKPTPLVNSGDGF